jgi:hypothetical protein
MVIVRRQAGTLATLATLATLVTLAAVAALAPAAAAAAAMTPPIINPAPIITPSGCLPSGDGYLRARLAGAITATIDWPNSGTLCQGEWRAKPPGVRLSFERPTGGDPNLLLVFGLTGVRAGKSARAIRTNVTVVVQGKSRIFGTLGDKRCTVDSLTQRPLSPAGFYRVEARGFCTSPAHAIHGDGDVLVSTFEFAGIVNFQDQPP